MADDEIEVEFRPIKKVVVFEKINLSKDELFKRLRLIALSGQPLALNWVEGVVFFAIPFHVECEKVVEETMNGIVYLSSIMFAYMPNYEPMQKIGGVEIPIIDQTASSYLRSLAIKLKNEE